MKMKFLLQKAFAIVCLCALSMTALANDIHVATTGSDENAGTEEAPLATIAKALELVQAGDRILIHEGTYYITKRLKIPELPTNPDMRCEMRAYPDDAAGKVIIDGTNMVASSEIEFKQSRCIYVNHLANYWTFYGLTLQNALDNGMKMEGSYNIVERCVFRWNNLPVCRLVCTRTSLSRRPNRSLSAEPRNSTLATLIAATTRLSIVMLTRMPT